MMNFDCVRGRENLFLGELELLPGTLPVTTSEKVFCYRDTIENNLICLLNRHRVSLLMLHEYI